MTTTECGSSKPSSSTPVTPFLGFGAGLRSCHYAEILEGKSTQIEWFEAISENYLGFGACPKGRPLENLLKIRANFPVVLHGVSLSIGGSDPLDTHYLQSLRTLYTIVEPAWVSDHLCWTGVHGRQLHDLLPLPYNEESIRQVVSRIEYVQEFLGRTLTLENVSSYLSFKHSEMSEWDFLKEIQQRSGCKLLLDVNNVFVSAHNHGFRAEDYILGLPPNAISQIHLAGHNTSEGLLIDTHDAPVCDAVWDLYKFCVQKLGPLSTMIEWDENIPSLARLEEEVQRAKQYAQSTLIARNSGAADPSFHSSGGAAVSV